MRAKPIIALAAVLLMGLVACEEDPDCPDCGKVTEGYLFKRVTQDDFAKFSGISGIEIDACMRYSTYIHIGGDDKVTGSTDINEESITLVDNCCCE